MIERETKAFEVTSAPAEPFACALLAADLGLGREDLLLICP